MGNPIVLESYIHTLEKSIDTLDIVQSGVGFISGLPKYHIKDSSIIRLINSMASEIRYDNDRLYWSFNGHGLDSPKEIKEELSDLIEAARKTLSYM